MASGYDASVSFNANYTVYSGGTLYGNASSDNTPFNNIPIGFPFVYNSTSYSVISINPNGFIAMGPSVSAAGNGVAYVSISDRSGFAIASPAGSNNIIAGFNMDLQSRIGGDLSTQLIGTAPFRTFVVQWKNYRKFGVTADTFNFQILLHEQTNVIKVRYGNNKYSPISNPFYAQVGLRGASNSDFNIRASTSSGWFTTEAGTANTGNILVSPTSLPFANLEFTWSPGGPPKDIALSKILNPITNGCLLDLAEPVVAVVQNRGSQPLDTFVAGYIYQGTVFKDTIILSPPLLNGFSDTLQLPASLNFSAPGSYTFKAFVSQIGESNSHQANDTLVSNVVSMPPVTNFPYSEPFSSTTELPLGWQSYLQTGPGWKLEGPTFNLALTSSLNITTVQGPGALTFDSYIQANTGKFSTVTSPCFNFSGISADSLILDVSYLQNNTFLAYPDSIVVRLSTDGGSNFTHKLATLLRPYQLAQSVQWSLASLNISAFKSNSLCKFSFTGYGANGYKVAIDNLRVRTANNQVSNKEMLSNQTGLLFPNPATNAFGFFDSFPSEVSVFSMSGSLIMQKNLASKESFSILSLKPGIYQVVRRVGNETIRQKLFKN